MHYGCVRAWRVTRQAQDGVDQNIGRAVVGDEILTLQPRRYLDGSTH